MKKDIAIVVQNYTQYANVEPGIKELKRRGRIVDIYCISTNDNEGYSEMFSSLEKRLTNQGIKVYNKISNYQYKVLLEPYPLTTIKSKYKIRYRYSNISAKPNIVYKPENYIIYDAYLAAGSYDSNFLGNYTKNYIVGNLKYQCFRHNPKMINGKKTLLYLPTYGKESSIDDVYSILSNLKDDYYIIAKIHHGTNYLKNEKKRISNLKKVVDELYDSDKNIEDLLKKTHIVLTDNSGAIFEALYTYVPVAVFAKDINMNKMNTFNSTQYELYKAGILPYTDNQQNIKKVLHMALNPETIAKQKKWSRENFCHELRPDKTFADIVELYIESKFDKRYYAFHSEFRGNYFQLKKENNDYLYQRNEAYREINEIKKEKEKILFEIEQLKQEKDAIYNKLAKYENNRIYSFFYRIDLWINRGKKWKK